MKQAVIGDRQLMRIGPGKLRCCDCARHSLNASIYIYERNSKKERRHYADKDFLDFWNSSKHFVGNDHILDIWVVECNQRRKYCRLGYAHSAQYRLPVVPIACRVHYLLQVNGKGYATCVLVLQRWEQTGKRRFNRAVLLIDGNIGAPAWDRQDESFAGC